MSSREQSLDIRTSSHRAPPMIMSFAFTSAVSAISWFFELIFPKVLVKLKSSDMRERDRDYHAVLNDRVQVRYVV